MYAWIHVSVEYSCVRVCATALWRQEVNTEYLFSCFPACILNKGVSPKAQLGYTVCKAQGACYLCLSRSWSGMYHCCPAFNIGVGDPNFIDWVPSLHLQSAFDLSRIITALESLFYFMILLSILYSACHWSTQFIMVHSLNSICCQFLLFPVFTNAKVMT